MIAFSLLLAAFYPQAPLYSENQNTKFLHGAALADWGRLAGDWTAGTLDPLPVFTILVECVFRWLHPFTFHLLFALLVAVYAWSAIGIATRVYPSLREGRAAWLFAAIFALLLLSPLNDKVATGVAGQYILDHYLQPCVLGAFMLLGIRLFLDGRLITTALCLTVAVLTHPGAYLLSALLVLSAVTWESWKNGLRRRSALPVLLFAAATVPLGIHQILAFAPSSETSWQLAMNILANQRIPHHTNVHAWLGFENAAKLVALVWTSWMVRTYRPLFLIMASLTGLVLLATLALLAIPNATAAFTTPWRVTAVSMPIAVVLLIGKVSLGLAAFTERYSFPLDRIRFVTLILILLALAMGVVKTQQRFREYHGAKSMGVIQHAKASAADGQIYLIPPKDNDFNCFRLETGLPALANWKSHPYLDTEVIEWYSRNKAAMDLYDARDDDVRNALVGRLAKRYGITHVVVPADKPITAAGYIEIFADRYFSIYLQQGI